MSSENKRRARPINNGMNSLGVRKALEQYPDLMRPLFLKGELECRCTFNTSINCSMHGACILFVFLLTDKIKGLFKKVVYSDAGTTEQEKEAATYVVLGPIT